MSRENVEIVQRVLGVGWQDDVSAALPYLHPDLEWIPGRSATEGTFRGHDGFAKFVADTNETFEIFEPDFEFRDLGDRVLAWGSIRVRGAGSGLEMDIPVAGLVDFRDGKILRWHDLGTKEQALEAAGLAPEL